MKKPLSIRTLLSIIAFTLVFIAHMMFISILHAGVTSWQKRKAASADIFADASVPHAYVAEIKRMELVDDGTGKKVKLTVFTPSFGIEHVYIEEGMIPFGSKYAYIPTEPKVPIVSRPLTF